tara:strand:- start:455 stop:592 length:138 start_codon:yes stop_codon:yes gene_type:complete
VGENAASDPIDEGFRIIISFGFKCIGLLNTLKEDPLGILPSIMIG